MQIPWHQKEKVRGKLDALEQQRDPRDRTAVNGCHTCYKLTVNWLEVEKQFSRGIWMREGCAYPEQWEQVWLISKCMSYLFELICPCPLCAPSPRPSPAPQDWLSGGMDLFSESPTGKQWVVAAEKQSCVPGERAFALDTSQLEAHLPKRQRFPAMGCKLHREAHKTFPIRDLNGFNSHHSAWFQRISKYGFSEHMGHH